MPNRRELPVKTERDKRWLLISMGVGSSALMAMGLLAGMQSGHSSVVSSDKAEYGLQFPRVTANEISEKGVITLTGQPFAYSHGSFSSYPGLMDATLSGCRRGGNTNLETIYTNAMGNQVMGYGEQIENETIPKLQGINVDGVDYICSQMYLKKFS